jgi:hypothetical protein
MSHVFVVFHNRSLLIACPCPKCIEHVRGHHQNQLLPKGAYKGWASDEMDLLHDDFESCLGLLTKHD